jgi:hypothetical protein
MHRLILRLRDQKPYTGYLDASQVGRRYDRVRSNPGGIRFLFKDVSIDAAADAIHFAPIVEGQRILQDGENCGRRLIERGRNV